jgi:hypothetical protein
MIQVETIQSNKRVAFITKVVQALDDIEIIYTVNRTSMVSRDDTVSVAEYAMCAVMTGKVWIDNNLG